MLCFIIVSFLCDDKIVQNICLNFRPMLKINLEVSNLIHQICYNKLSIHCVAFGKCMLQLICFELRTLHMIYVFRNYMTIQHIHAFHNVCGLWSPKSCLCNSRVESETKSSRNHSSFWLPRNENLKTVSVLPVYAWRACFSKHKVDFHSFFNCNADSQSFVQQKHLWYARKWNRSELYMHNLEHWIRTSVTLYEAWCAGCYDR